MRFTPLSGAVMLAVFDEVALREREDEVAVGDVHLAAAELAGVDARLTLWMISSGSSRR
jgi:hypothetical protein